MLKQVGLKDIRERRIANLSGGQRKRAAVALELISGPELLLLDEPTTGLDPGLERRLMELTRRLADRGQGVLLVTHATQSLDLCDRVAVMAPGGRLAYIGPPQGAPQAFGVERVEEVYAKLADEAERAVSPKRVEASITPPRLASSGGSAAADLATGRGTLVRRYSILFLRDRRNATILAAQVLILGLGAAFLFHSGVFSYNEMGEAEHPAKAHNSPS